MGAIVASAFVSCVAIVAFLYYHYQDRKATSK